MSAKAAPLNQSIIVIDPSLLTLDQIDLAKLEKIAFLVAQELNKGDLIRLDGDLGAGKSQLARFIIQKLAGFEIEVPSPTFTLMQVYAVEGLTICHADLYRLSDESEVVELGLLDDLDQGNALLVEWSENAGDLLPKTGLRIHLEIMPDSKRRLRFQTLSPGYEILMAKLNSEI